MRSQISLVAVAYWIAFTIPGPSALAEAQQRPAPQVDLTQLWEEPTDLAERDLFAGPGGTDLIPAHAVYEFVAHKLSGKNRGYDVRDPSGRLWSVKLGDEAQSEVTASRILWAMGFHQPATYYVAHWTLSGEDAGVKTLARFRSDDGAAVVGEWSWYENPFAGTRPFGGLVAAQLILNNWDLKTSNNKVYESSAPGTGPRRMYVVRDLGASLGTARQSPFFQIFGIRDRQGTKNDLRGFEQQGFIEEVTPDRVTFDYRGLDGALLKTMTVADIVWACDRLSRLSDAHWDAAFRAGGYTPEQRDRYVRKIKEKISQGLALRRTP